MPSRRHLEPPTRERRERYELKRSPADEASPIVRQTLEVLRPVLGTIWLDAEPQGEWPEPLQPAAEALAAMNRVQQERPPTAQRAGSRPTTVVLDPANDADFDLAVTLAPFSRDVEAMSVEGVLVYGRGRTEELIQLRLTVAEYQQLNDPARPRQLVRRRGRDSEDSVGKLLFYIPLCFVLGPNLARDSLPDVLDPELDWSTVYAAIGLLGGLGVFVSGVVGGVAVFVTVLPRAREWLLRRRATPSANGSAEPS